jgi:hypothetical protein
MLPTTKRILQLNNRHVLPRSFYNLEKRFILVDGKRGMGKSTFLDYMAHNSKSIIIMPDLFSFTNGTAEYALVGDEYHQSKLALMVLGDVLKRNKSLLQKILVKGQPADKFISNATLSNAHDALDQTLECLVPHALFCLDRVNALYSKTRYYDKESKVLHSDRFRIVQSFQRVLNNPSPKIVAAMDYSISEIKSPFLESTLYGIEPIISFEDHTIKKEPVGDNVPHLSLHEPERVIIPPFTVSEVGQMLQHYLENGISKGF